VRPQKGDLKVDMGVKLIQLKGFAAKIPLVKLVA
jgi:hypothetical protein